ncbi:MAG: S8 family serine peptidase [Bdellovibrionaceae bacterium]|nr:S8 family serine peptidase [Pseudobdellovibrionaceae bacterium]
MKRVLRALACFGFIAVSFTVWGMLQTLISKRPASVSVSGQSDSDRELILNAAQKVSQKAGAKESKVLLNDPNIAEKWGLKKTEATRAWEVSQGSKDINVCIIDTGADVEHKDLKDNLWVNAGETGPDAKGRDKSKNGIDDDGNGYIDDIHGWNFVHNNNVLTDTHGHGTHIAGIIGARGGNNFGISGVSPRVSLMILKYYDPNTNNLENTIKAIKYCVQNNAHIINYSGGGVEYSQKEFASVKEAEKKGILFVSAAGNEKSNSDEKGKHYFPADYELSNIISVTAINDAPKEATQVLASSNYGVRTVDLAAPGENIYSTLPGNSFGMMTGTSQATAFVTGVAALVMANNREFSATDVKKYILRNGDEHPSLAAKTGTSKVLNSYKALTSMDINVAATGVIATNTATIPKEAFQSNSNLKDPRMAPSALRASTADAQDTAEAFAGFGKDLLKAIKSGVTTNPALDESDELRTR